MQSPNSAQQDPIPDPKIEKKKREIPLDIRPYNPDTDRAFVFSSWLQSFQSSTFSCLIPKDVYFSAQHKVIEMLLKRSQVFMACDQDDNDHIYAYIVGEYLKSVGQEVFALHWMYVKSSFRGFDIPRKLLAQYEFKERNYYTHDNSFMRKIALYVYLRHNPYMIFLGGDENGKPNQQNETHGEI